MGMGERTPGEAGFEGENEDNGCYGGWGVVDVYTDGFGD